MTDDVELIEHCFIPLPDGTRLAARIWLPRSARKVPVPALLEYLPYRKSDGTAGYDPITHAFFARHGYGAVRVDIRGTGDSDGLLTDEYSELEQNDGVNVIAWLAEQPWCNGRVGMFGVSWGGFNALQVAAKRPSALQAIVTACSTDDRYADDVHYIGGCIDALDVIGWPVTFTALQARPPSPLVRADWRERWLERLDALPHFAAIWLEHQRRDAYWRSGSVCEDFAAIECPVFAVGGWADGYKNAVLRLLAGLSAPRRGLIGPWAHGWPHLAAPGPRIAFLTECLRWWNRWLKDDENGVDTEPMLTVWEQRWCAPESASKFRPGRWIAEERWPPPDDCIEAQRWFWADDGLSRTPVPMTPTLVQTDLRHGAAAGLWCAFGGDDLPRDQSEELEASVFRETPVANAPQSVLGHAIVRLRLTSDRPIAHVVVRLCDVAPDGAMLLVARGVLNLCHRDGHAQVELLAPGQQFEATVELDCAAHRLAEGHRWRLAIAPSYWPMIWPSPEPVTLTVHAAELVLPIRRPSPLDDALPPFGAADGAAPLAIETLSPPQRSSDQRASADAVDIEMMHDYGRSRLPDGLEIHTRARNTSHVALGQTVDARIDATRDVTLARGDWRVHMHIDATLRTDRGELVLEQRLEAFEGDAQVRRKEWATRLPRDGV